MIKKFLILSNVLLIFIILYIGNKHYSKTSNFYPNNFNNPIYTSSKKLKVQNPKVIYIGVDGLDLDIIGNNLSNLPNFKHLINNGAFGYSFPYNPSLCSPENFLSILTGRTSSQHGITSFFSKENELLMSSSNIRCNTVFDLISKKYNDVYSINHFASWPIKNRNYNTVSQLYIVRKGLEQTFGKVKVFNELLNNFYGDFDFKDIININNKLEFDSLFKNFKDYLKLMKDNKLKTSYSQLQKSYQKKLVDAKSTTNTYFDYIGLNEKEIDKLSITNKEMIKKRVNFYKKLTNTNFLYMIPMQVLSFIVDQISLDIFFKVLNTKKFSFLSTYLSSFDEFMHTFHQYEPNEITKYLKYLDSQVGRILKSIDDNTLLIISSDHGFNSVWQKTTTKSGSQEFKYTSDHTNRGSIFIYSKKYTQNRFIKISSILDVSPTILYYMNLNSMNLEGKPLIGIFK